MAQQSPQPLTARGLCVKADGRLILKHVGFSLWPGEMCALIGPSGAGKSTLIRVLLGLLQPSAGTATIFGDVPGEGGPIGYVPQDDALHRELTVGRELDYALQLRCPELDADARGGRIARVLRQVGLAERRDLRIKKLSGGQRKRVAVALELLASPSLLILDEPTSGLDPGLERQMMRLFGGLAADGRVVMVATHAMRSLSLCQAVLVLVRGGPVFFGSPLMAQEYFQVDRLGDLFERLNEKEGGEWTRLFHQSAAKRTFESRPPPSLAQPPRRGREEPPLEPAPAARAERFDGNDALEALKRKIAAEEAAKANTHDDGRE